MRLDLSQDRPGIDLRDAELHLTAAQALACDIDKEVMVTAGAGSGKTHTLSLRYVVLLLEIAVESVRVRPHDPRPEIQQVLVLTFTERAAQEMAQRCYERLLELSSACRQQAEELEAAFGRRLAKGLPLALSRLLDRFDEARVSTFHGFCASLHSDFPEACETPAESRIAEADEAQRILDEALSNTLRDFGQEYPKDLRTLMGAFGSRDQVLDSARTAIQKRARLRDFLHSSAEGQLDTSSLVQQASLTPSAASSWLKAQGLPLLAKLQSLLAPSRGGPAFKEHVWPAIEGAITDPNRPLALYQAYTAVLGSVLTDKGTVRTLTHHSFVGTKADWPAPEQRLAAVASLRDLSSEFSDWPGLHQVALTLPTPADSSMLDALQVLSRLVLSTVDRYDVELNMRGLLDFDSLQRRAIEAVLNDPGIVHSLAKRHRYIMVDEFQDTDPAQWELVLRLGRPQGVSSDRLFLVGDAKQAIYGFRGGDVTVFQAAGRELGVEPILFPENFRSRTELIDWFNPFFASLLGPQSEGRPDWEASHQELRPARGQTRGSVRLLTHQEPTGPAAAAAEAKGIAAFLCHSVFGPGGLLGPKQASAGGHALDVAILLRARTHLHLFEEALRAAQIPFHVGGGVGFWGRPEIVDLVNVLHALATGDEVSTVGALRSPLFALNDDEVQALYGAESRRQTPGFKRQLLPETKGPFLAIAQGIWTGLLRDRHRLPWPMLLREVLLATQAAHALELTGGARSHANVQRLLDISDQLAGNGMNRLEEAAELFLQNVQKQERETEASVSNAAARVVVLTIHASKGLEFPVVILPGLDSRPPGNTASILCQRIEGRMEMACRVEDPNAALQTRVTPGSWHRLSTQSRLEEDAERKRLLYVAATRARDHLVLVGGTSRIASDGTTWMHQIAAHHGKDLASLPTEPLNWQSPLARQLRSEVKDPADTGLAKEPPEPTTVRLSPSGMNQFRRCPARWYRASCLGIPEPQAPSPEFPEAATRGSVLHALLEHNLEESDKDALRLWRVEAARSGGNLEDIALGETHLLRHLEACRNSQPLAAALAADGYNELGFTLRHGVLEISGVIDRLWKDTTSQEWCVLDYKSDSTDTGTSDQEIAEHHITQLAAYAWAAEQVLSAQRAGKIGPLQVFLTSTGNLQTVGSWTADSQKNFEALLESITLCAQSSWEDVMQTAQSADTPRPCQTCGYHQQGCRGQA